MYLSMVQISLRNLVLKIMKKRKAGIAKEGSKDSLWGDRINMFISLGDNHYQARGWKCRDNKKWSKIPRGGSEGHQASRRNRNFSIKSIMTQNNQELLTIIVEQGVNEMLWVLLQCDNIYYYFQWTLGKIWPHIKY